MIADNSGIISQVAVMFVPSPASAAHINALCDIMKMDSHRMARMTIGANTVRLQKREAKCPIYQSL